MRLAPCALRLPGADTVGSGDTSQVKVRIGDSDDFTSETYSATERAFHSLLDSEISHREHSFYRGVRPAVCIYVTPIPGSRKI